MPFLLTYLLSLDKQVYEGQFADCFWNDWEKKKNLVLYPVLTTNSDLDKSNKTLLAGGGTNSRDPGSKNMVMFPLLLIYHLLCLPRNTCKSYQVN